MWNARIASCAARLSLARSKGVMGARLSCSPISTATGGTSPASQTLKFDVKPRTGYLDVVARGTLDLAGAQAALAELLADAARRHQPRILLDCSRLVGTWGPDERYTVGSFIATEMERRESQFP